MKFSISILLIFFTINAPALEIASKGDLLNAFNGKYITVDTGRSLACFVANRNSIEVIRNGSCAKSLDDVIIDKKGRVCLHYPSKKKCAKVRVLSNGDYALGKRLRVISIYPVEQAPKTQSVIGKQKKYTKSSNAILSCVGDTIKFRATSNRSHDYDTYWEEVTIFKDVLNIPKYGKYQKEGRRWVMKDGWAKLNVSSGKLTATLTYHGSKKTRRQLQATCSQKVKKIDL